MSGAEATYGQEQYDGLSLAVSLFNTAGGFTAGPLKGCKVKILGPYDDESQPSLGATIATRLSTNSHLLMYFGDVDSGVTLAALPILSRAGIPVINSYSSSPELTSLGYKNFFRVILNDNSQGAAIADLLKNTFHDTSYAAVWPDDVFGQGISASFLQEAAKLGASVPVNYSYPATQTDFSVLASKVRGAHVDAVALLGVYSGDGLIVKQLASSGVPPSSSTVYLANASDNAPQFVSLAGTSAANGVYITGLWDPANASAAGKVFACEVRERLPLGASRGRRDGIRRVQCLCPSRRAGRGQQVRPDRRAGEDNAVEPVRGIDRGHRIPLDRPAGRRGADPAEGGERPDSRCTQPVVRRSDVPPRCRRRAWRHITTSRNGTGA